MYFRANFNVIKTKIKQNRKTIVYLIYIFNGKIWSAFRIPTESWNFFGFSMYHL